MTVRRRRFNVTRDAFVASSAQRPILEKYKPAVKAAHRYRAWCTKSLCVDDLVQVGMLAVEEASKDFDESRGRWYPYAYRRALTAVQRHAQCHSKTVDVSRRTEHVYVRSLDRLLPWYDEPVCELDLLPAPPSRYREYAEILCLADNVLTGRERKVFTAYWEHDKTLAEIGKPMNLTLQRVGQILKKAEQTVREAIL